MCQYWPFNTRDFPNKLSMHELDSYEQNFTDNFYQADFHATSWMSKRKVNNFLEKEAL